jgi:hypothetical protein
VGVVRYAAEAVGIARETAHRWRREDEAVAQQFDEAAKRVTQELQRRTRIDKEIPRIGIASRGAGS